MRFRKKLNEDTLDDIVKNSPDELSDVRKRKAQERKAREEEERNRRQSKGEYTAMERWNKERADELKEKEEAKEEVTPEEQALLNRYAEPDDEVVYYEGDIEKALNDAFRTAMNQRWKEEYMDEYGDEELDTEFPVIWLVGDAGTGKTTRVKKWLKRNGVPMIERSLASMDDTDVGGAVAADLANGKAIRLSSDEFDAIEEVDTPCVLFLDEYLRGTPGVRNTLLGLVNNHLIPDKASKGGMKYYPNLLFVVGATNPYTAAYTTKSDFDSAELSRGEVIPVIGSKEGWLHNFAKTKRAEIRAAIKDHRKNYAYQQMGKLEIAQALIDSPRFEFDSAQEISELLDWEALRDPNHGNPKIVQTSTGYNIPILNSRSLSKLFESCDGTVSDFLERWDRYCNPTKKDIVQDILDDIDITDYTYELADDDWNEAEEVDDKANSVFKKKEKTAAEEFDDLF